MEQNIWLPWFASVAVAVIAAIPGVLVWIGSRQKSNADTAATYQQIANRAAERALSLQSQITTLERRIDEQDEEMRKLMCERDDLQEWAERLVHQVQSLGGQPVTFRSNWQDRWHECNDG